MADDEGNTHFEFLSTSGSALAAVKFPGQREPGGQGGQADADERRGTGEEAGAGRAVRRRGRNTEWRELGMEAISDMGTLLVSVLEKIAMLRFFQGQNEVSDWI